MRLVTFKPDDGRARLGAMLAGGGVLDLQQAAGGAAEFASMLALIEAGPGAWERARGLVAGPPGKGVHGAENCALLAPMPLPPQVRDFMCFEKHVIQAFGAAFRMRATRAASAEEKAALLAQAAGVPAAARVVRAPALLQGQPLLGQWAGRHDPLARLQPADGLRVRAGLHHRRGRRGHPARARDGARVRLHDLQRLQRARRAGRRDGGRPRAGQGQGLRRRQCLRSLHRDRRRDTGSLRAADDRPGQRRGTLARQFGRRCTGSSRT